MKKIIRQSLLLGLTCLALNINNSRAQFNHLTMSMQNVVQLSSNIIQFDLYTTSDGDSTSDLRMNSVQYGINFDTLILQTGDTISTSYLIGTSDFIPPLNPFNYPKAVSKNHIRIVQSPYVGGNTGNKMVVGQTYRVGTFRLQCSTNWVNGSSPKFYLQDSVEIGKTMTMAVVWEGSGSNTIGFYTPASRGLVVNDSIVLTSVNEIDDASIIQIYPNPSGGRFTIIFKHAFHNASLKIFNTMGIIIKQSEITNSKSEIDLSTFSQGIYFLQINDGGQLYVKKIMIQ